MPVNPKGKHQRKNSIWANNYNLWQPQKRRYEKQLKCTKADWNHQKVMYKRKWFNKKKTRIRFIQEKNEQTKNDWQNELKKQGCSLSEAILEK